MSLVFRIDLKHVNYITSPHIYIPRCVISALTKWWLNRIIRVCAYTIMRAFVSTWARLHSASRSETLSHSCSCLSGSLSILLLPPGFLKKSQCCLTISEPRKCCFVWRMGETLLSGISRSRYCNSFSVLCCSNSQDKTALLMTVALHFALCVALVLPSGLRASIPTPATVDFAMKTGHGYHA